MRFPTQHELKVGKLYRATRACHGVLEKKQITGSYREIQVLRSEIVIALGRNRVLNPQGLVVCLVWTELLENLELVKIWK